MLRMVTGTCTLSTPIPKMQLEETLSKFEIILNILT